MVSSEIWSGLSKSGPRTTMRNWLFAGASGPFALALSLYDTSINTDTGLTGLRMPAIKKLGCV